MLNLQKIFNRVFVEDADALRTEQKPYIGTPTVLKDEISDNDAEPLVGSGIDCSEAPSIRLEVTIGGSGTGWTITPCYANDSDSVYRHGDPIAVSSADPSVVFTVPSFGASDFTVRCDGKYGTSPELSVTATPYGG